MVLGFKTLKFQTSGTTLRELIRDLGKMAGKDIGKEVLTPQGDLSDGFKIFVNGRSCSNLENSIEDGDDIVLFSIIDGG